MIANVITLCRVILTFGVIALFGRNRLLDIAMVVTIVLIFTLDALDGIVARKRDEVSEIGVVFDTVADRVIENTFWIYFTVVGCIPVWMPIVVMARGFFTDGLQRITSCPKENWATLLARSRTSRAFYGATKMLAFMCFASISIFENLPLEKAGMILAIITVGFCILRGLPFFFIRLEKY